MDLTEWKHPSVGKVDPTKIAVLERCPREYLFAHVLGWQPDQSNHHLVCGIGVHVAMDYLLHHPGEWEMAFELYLREHRKYYAPHEDEACKNKSPRNIQRALKAYVERYPNDDWEVLHVEVPGSVPVTEEDSLFCNVDCIVRTNSPLFGMPSTQGQILFIDHKTTGWDNDWWRAQWRLNYQMSAYVHLLCSCFDPQEVFGAILNGIVLRIGDMDTPVMDKETGEQAVYKVGEKKGQPRWNKGRGAGNDFIRIPVSRTDDLMNAWLAQTQYLFSCLKEWTEALEGASPEDPSLYSWPQRTTNCIRYNRACPYQEFCLTTGNPLTLCEQYGPEDAPPGFKKEYWDPELRSRVDKGGNTL